jgi:hypothetical protein
MNARPRRVNFRANCRNLLSLALALGLCAGLLVLPARTASAQVVVTSGVRISQLYTRGGEPGAAFQNDFIEIFNGGIAPINVHEWELHLESRNGNVTTVTSVAIFSLGGTLTLNPGRYLLIKLGGGPEGQPLPPADVDLSFVGGFLNLSSTGQVALLRRGAAPLTGFVCPELPRDGVEDYVGYGASSCREGNASAPAPTLAESVKRAAAGCTDTNNNASDFTLGPAAPRNGQTPAAPCVASPGASTINFGVPQFFTSESDGRAQIVVSRVGDLSTPASVDYFTADGTASERRDYTTAAGTLRFEAGEQFKTFDVLVNGDAYVEGNETVNLVLLNPSGASLGVRPTAQLTLHDGLVFTPPPAGHPSDATPFFVRQHYHDFLSREPDAGGLSFWSQGINDCATPDCVRAKRVDTSAAFFLSIEFQQTGYFVYRLYKASLPPRALRPRGMPRYREFVRDTQQIGRGVVVGEGDWAARLDANRRDFLDAFVARPEFTDNYPASLTPAEYVQKLNQQAGGVLSLEEAAALIGGLIVGDETRATVLGRVADDTDFTTAEFNRAFVLMQYFGYLRRDPDAPGFDGQPDPDFVGFDFWLKKLNDNHGDFRAAEMVRAFIESIEYRQRFGQ